MYNQHKISMQEHIKFLNSLKNSPLKRYFLLKENNNYLGVINFHIKKNYAQIGLYKNPHLKKVGKKLLSTAIEYGFKKLKLKKLVLFVFENNQRAIALYEKCGFKKIQKKDNLIKMELYNENRKT